MVDLTIRGAGIIGLTIAFKALARGASVRVIDPDGPGAGASGGIVGALAPHTPDGWNPKKQMQLESLLAHRTFWPEVEKASGLPSGYCRTGRLQPILDDRARDLALERAAAAVRTWGESATWQVTDAPGKTAPPSPTGLWSHDTLSAHIHPRQAIASLARAVTRQGGQITRDAPEEGLVLHATGAAGLNALSRSVGKTVGTGIKGQAALFALDLSGAPQIFADGLHIIPHADGTTAVGSTTEREFSDPVATDAALDEVIDRAIKLLPALANAAVIERWAGLRPRARTRAPMLGPWPGRPDHFIANGGFKIGFGMAPGMADLILDLMLEGRDALPDNFRIAANL